MTVTLSKGGNVSLRKEAKNPNLQRLLIGLGWQARQTSGAEFDLDASALMVGTNDKVVADPYFVFYSSTTRCKELDGSGVYHDGGYDDGGYPCDPEASVVHTGDNTTGAGDGDDEALIIQLNKVRPEVQRIIFPVTIFDAVGRKQNFGMVSGAFIRVVDIDTEQEIARFDLSEDASVETTLIFGELYRNPSDPADWKFRAIQQGYDDGLAGLARAHGVHVGA